MKMTLAIDPGANGGIVKEVCYVDTFMTRVVAASRMPDTPGDVLNALRFGTDAFSDPPVAVMEAQTFCAGLAVSAPAMGKFGRNFGFIEGALMALGYRVILIKPQEWIKGLGLGKRDKSLPKSAWKNKLKAEAQRLFPKIEVTLATADALLMLEYYRRTHEQGTGK